MKIRVEFIPRGKSGSPLTSPLKFVGDCIGVSNKVGHYKIWDGSCTYNVPIQDMFEVVDGGSDVQNEN